MTLELTPSVAPVPAAASHRPLLEIACEIHSLFLPTAAQEKAFQRLCDYTQLSMVTGKATGLALVGEPGAGKSKTLTRWLEWAKKTYPDKLALFVDSQGDPTPKSITEELLTSAKDPFSHVGSANAKLKRLGILVSQGEIIAIAFDEFQHLLTGNSAAKITKANQLVKSLFNRLGIPLFLVGLPEIIGFIRASRELERRFGFIVELPICDISNPIELREIRTVLQAQDKIVPFDEGVSLRNEGMVMRFVLASNGSLGDISKILQQACIVADEGSAARVGMRHLSKALLELSVGKKGVPDYFSLSDDDIRKMMGSRLAEMKTGRRK